ncbi:ABC transporter ATP-binding protein [Curtobacterium flaccumfaciens]|nr:ABC transporter ATP-binding protein [Curtobacterium flaccumfaciens]
MPSGTDEQATADAGTATATDAAANAPDAIEPDAPAVKATKKRPAAKRPATPQKQPQQPVVLRAAGLVKRYGQTLAADEVDLEIRQGSIFGVVGPNGAGKTTTLSMVTGLLRPDAGTVTVLDHDVWADPTAAKRDLGVLPDRLRLFDRLTGAQLLYYSATLRGLDGATARQRSADLAEAFGLGEALGRQVADYSVGMAKKIALAATLIHSPRVLVLDEPFESVDPVSAATITEILRRYTRGGGTVVLSSHSMELVQRTCDSVAIIVGGKVLASGTMAQVRGRRASRTSSSNSRAAASWQRAWNGCTASPAEGRPHRGRGPRERPPVRPRRARQPRGPPGRRARRHRGHRSPERGSRGRAVGHRPRRLARRLRVHRRPARRRPPRPVRPATLHGVRDRPS